LAALQSEYSFAVGQVEASGQAQLGKVRTNPLLVGQLAFGMYMVRESLLHLLPLETEG
jgi:hypothetical protein